MGQVFTGARRATLANAQLMPAADVTLTQNTFTEAGRYEVPAGVAIVLGYGRLMGQANAEGRAYADIQDALAAQIPGQIRLDIQDATGRHLGTAWEGFTAELFTSATDLTQQLPFPEQPTVQPMRATPGNFIVVYINTPEVAPVLTVANCIYRFSATFWSYKVV